MKITINDILTTQAILDQAIQTKHQTTYASTVNEIKLALIVELGELANEVRSFKFWSYKNPSNKEVILEEYVDGLHFIISFVIMYKIKLQLIIPDHLPQLTKQQLTIKFNDLFALITQLNLKVNINNKTVIKRWLKQYIILGYNLGFNINDIRQAYFAKNKINFDRQNNNY